MTKLPVVANAAGERKQERVEDPSTVAPSLKNPPKEENQVLVSEVELVLGHRYSIRRRENRQHADLPPVLVSNSNHIYDPVDDVIFRFKPPEIS